MSIQGYYLMPHPPIVIPEVGKGEEKKIEATFKSLHEIGKEIKEKACNTIIIVTPHGTMFQDAIGMLYEDKIEGDFKKFGVPEVTMQLEINKQLTNKIYQLALEQNIPVVMETSDLLKKYHTSFNLDHGAMVPLYFVNKYYRNYKIVHITYAPISDIELYKFGMIITKAVEELNEKVVFIASGDLSHRLKEEGPYDYSPFGEKFDKEFLYQLERGEVINTFEIDEKIICNAGECGRRSASILLGTLEEKKFRGKLLSYEGTFGVGYGVMKFEITGKDKSKLLELKEIKKKDYSIFLNETDPYLKLAKETLITYLTTGEIIDKIPPYVTDEMKRNKRGVFVSLKKLGELRGCIGTIYPTTNSVAEEIIRNAIAAAINDPRFEKVEETEIFDLEFSVDELMPPEPATKEDLNPKEYGVIVSNRGRKGLLLPNLEGVDTVEEQLDISLRKGGISENENYSIERFKVIRHKSNI